jgi:hypothetical protein
VLAKKFTFSFFFSLLGFEFRASHLLGHTSSLLLASLFGLQGK